MPRRALAWSAKVTLDGRFWGAAGVARHEHLAQQPAPGLPVRRRVLCYTLPPCSFTARSLQVAATGEPGPGARTGEPGPGASLRP